MVGTVDIAEQVLCRLDELGDPASRGFSLRLGETRLEMFVVRRGDDLVGYRNNCPHTGAPLDWSPDQFLDADDKFIQCAMHGALFTVENGYCVLGPCAGQSLQRIPLQLRAGVVTVDPAYLAGVQSSP
jgi:nitrite reductase/ring-hydroxylating ferredoxin subunit